MQDRASALARSSRSGILPLRVRARFLCVPDCVAEGEDSNPRYCFRYSGFQDVPFLTAHCGREAHCERAAAGGGGTLFRLRKRSAPSLKVTTSTAPESRSFASAATCLANSATVMGSHPSCSSPIPWNVSKCQQSGRTHLPTFSLFEI